MTKVAVVIPSRGDRPELLAFQLERLEQQTTENEFLFVMNHQPVNDQYDIVQRYRGGFQMAKESGADLVLCMEDDDWYNGHYIETMITKWLAYGKPDLIGISQTMYYHLFSGKYTMMHHPARASMFCTGISTKADIDWCKDDNPFLDLHLWRKNEHLTKHTFADPTNFKLPLAIGMKHGIGKSGGSAHPLNWGGWNKEDVDSFLFNSMIDPLSKVFYHNLKNKYGKESIGAGTTHR